MGASERYVCIGLYLFGRSLSRVLGLSHEEDETGLVYDTLRLAQFGT